MSEADRLYRVNIKTPTSPEELHAFCELLEDAGYDVVTDLKSGTVEIHEGTDD